MSCSFASCADEEDDSMRSYHVELLMGMNEREDGGVITRALPAGYESFDPDEDPGRIGVFMTQKQTGSYTYTSTSGFFTWKSKGKWDSSVMIMYDDTKPEATDNNYWIYGFMPASSGIGATITSSDFEAGAVMRLTNVPPVSAQDLCIVTGVLPGVPKDSGTGYKDISDVSVEVGKYAFQASAENAIYLLMDHLYSKYILTMRVDDGYNSMRTLKVTNMSMTASAPAVNVSVTYQQSHAPVKSISASEETTPVSSEILDNEEGEELNTVSKELTEFFCANLIDFITLTTTFDVYDKYDNLLRKDCTTVNKIKIQNLEPGKKYTILATIKPTYLYQLGETDLNQPTIVIE